jgi:hypothetical protein
MQETSTPSHAEDSTPRKRHSDGEPVVVAPPLSPPLLPARNRIMSRRVNIKPVAEGLCQLSSMTTYADRAQHGFPHPPAALLQLPDSPVFMSKSRVDSLCQTLNTVVASAAVLQEQVRIQHGMLAIMRDMNESLARKHKRLKAKHLMQSDVLANNVRHTNRLYSLFSQCLDLTCAAACERPLHSTEVLLELECSHLLHPYCSVKILAMANGVPGYKCPRCRSVSTTTKAHKLSRKFFHSAAEDLDSDEYSAVIGTALDVCNIERAPLIGPIKEGNNLNDAIESLAGYQSLIGPLQLNTRDVVNASFADTYAKLSEWKKSIMENSEQCLCGKCETDGTNPNDGFLFRAGCNCMAVEDFSNDESDD